MAAGRRLRGKSGLHKATVPGNARPGKPEGKRHRKHTAPAGVRVKRWGKSPPRPWRQGRHGKPRRSQDRIGSAVPSVFGLKGQGVSAPPTGLIARGARRRASQMNGYPWGLGPGTEPGVQAIRADFSPISDSPGFSWEIVGFAVISRIQGA